MRLERAIVDWVDKKQGAAQLSLLDSQKKVFIQLSLWPKIRPDQIFLVSTILSEDKSTTWVKVAMRLLLGYKTGDILAESEDGPFGFCIKNDIFDRKFATLEECKREYFIFVGRQALGAEAKEKTKEDLYREGLAQEILL